MDADVRVWALLIFSLCCCLLKGMISRHFRFRVVYEKSSLRLLWCGDAWVTCVIAEHNTVVYNRAVQNHAGKLHTPAQVKNHGQQHEEGKIWDTVKKNSKEPKMSSSPSSFSRIPVHCPQSSCAMSKLFSRIPVHSKQQQQGILVNKERANNLEPLALLIERGHAHGHRVQPKRSLCERK